VTAGPLDLRAAARVMRRMAGELAGLAASFEAAADEGERAPGDGAESEDDIRRQRDELARALAKLKVTHDALIAERETRARPSSRPAGLKVMIVDDAQAELKLMESILKAAGHRVVACGDGDGVEERVIAERPDVLLLDILMPNRNGYEILRALKKDDRTRDTAVVVVSAKNQESDRIWSRRQGAAEHVMKPFTPEQLVTTVEKLGAATTAERG